MADPITHAIVQVSNEKNDKDQPRKVIMGAVYNAGEKFTIPIKDAKNLEKDGAVRILEELTSAEYTRRLVGPNPDQHDKTCQCSFHQRQPVGAKA